MQTANLKFSIRLHITSLDCHISNQVMFNWSYDWSYIPDGLCFASARNVNTNESWSAGSFTATSLAYVTSILPTWPSQYTSYNSSNGTKKNCHYASYSLTFWCARPAEVRSDLQLDRSWANIAPAVARHKIIPRNPSTTHSNGRSILPLSAYSGTRSWAVRIIQT